jgi:hypothetical protein
MPRQSLWIPEKSQESLTLDPTAHTPSESCSENILKGKVTEWGAGNFAKQFFISLESLGSIQTKITLHLQKTCITEKKSEF